MAASELVPGGNTFNRFSLMLHLLCVPLWQDRTERNEKARQLPEFRAARNRSVITVRLVTHPLQCRAGYNRMVRLCHAQPKAHAGISRA
jgi:hypothetical protein